MLSWQQSKVSKIETLKQLPTESDVTAWAGATGAAARTAGLLERLRCARIEYMSVKDAYRSAGAAGTQADLLALEKQSARIAEFQPAMIPGLLQTADYAREFLHLPCGPLSFGAGSDDVGQMVASRLERQQVLYQQGKQVQVIILEGALRTRVVPAPTLAGQLDRLTALAGLPTLELGIIPFEAAVPVFPFSGFRLYDGIVIVESIVGEQQLSDEENLTRYENYLGLLRESAVTGREAIPVIQRAASGLR